MQLKLLFLGCSEPLQTWSRERSCEEARLITLQLEELTALREHVEIKHPMSQKWERCSGIEISDRCRWTLHLLHSPEQRLPSIRRSRRAGSALCCGSSRGPEQAPGCDALGPAPSRQKHSYVATYMRLIHHDSLDLIQESASLYCMAPCPENAVLQLSLCWQTQLMAFSSQAFSTETC